MERVFPGIPSSSGTCVFTKEKIPLKNVSPSDAFSFDDLECEAYHKVELKTGRPLYQRAKNYF